MSIMDYHKTDDVFESKADQFKDYPHTYDPALPYDWLKEFSAWCRGNYPGVDYNTICCTTVIAYPSDGYARPVTTSRAVEAAFKLWDATQTVTYNED